MKTIKAVTRLDGVPDAIVDNDLYDVLNRYKWNVTRKLGSNNFYYHTKINGKWVKMHSLIIGIDCPQVDHINHITNDNRRCNLIASNNSFNSHNRQKLTGTSKFKGVYREGLRWRSTIRKDQKTIHVGRYDTEEEAAKAYDIIAKKLYGEFASTNF